MTIKSGILSIIILVIGLPSGYSQLFYEPNYALKSHETLELSKVEVSGSSTVVYLSLENRIANGTFCADRNIYLIEPDGKKLKLIKASGIPVCPESYKFKMIGEKLQFKLEFSSLKAGTKWVDIIEDCSDNCFSFYGVTLDNELNEKIDQALLMAEKGETSKAIALYKNIINSQNGSDNGVVGGIYADIITLSNKAGDKAGAGEWYKKLESSNVPRIQLYIKNLNSRGIKF
jgi:hypothetical protein